MKKDIFKRKWIENATYEEMLRKWRHAELGDDMFMGDLGTFYATMMASKKSKLTSAEQVQTSKRIGW